MSFSNGGAASGALNLCKALEAAGLDILRMDARQAQARSWKGVARIAERLVERALYGPETHCLRLAPATFDLRALVEEHRPDVIQLCDVSGNVIDFADLAELPCPVVHRMCDFWPYHGPRHYATRPNEGPWGARWLLRSTVLNNANLPEARVAPSRWLADLLADTGGSSLNRVIRNSVDMPVIGDRPMPRAGAVRLGFISRDLLHPRKGLVALLPLLEGLAQRQRGASLHLFGNIARSARPKIAGLEVHIHRPYQREDLHQVFESFDILLCPSLLDNSPNVVSEALAHGRPVVAQSGTGMDSYVDHTTGALVDFQARVDAASSALIGAVDAILADYPGFSNRAVEYARKHLSPEVIGEAYRDLYADLLARRCPKR